MSAYAMGFTFIMLFTMLVGVAAVIFISFDAKASKNPQMPTTTQNRYSIVRRINTETIETVDATGSIQQWTRSAQ
jgi:hypothetical protein